MIMRQMSFTTKLLPQVGLLINLSGDVTQSDKQRG